VLIMLPMLEGRLPLSVLLLESRYAMLLQFPMLGGRLPVRLLLRRSR